MKYSLFIGRWQGLHDGHRWLWDQALKEGKNVLIAIRDVELDDPDEDNRYTCEEVYDHITEEMSDYIYTGKVKVMIVPDIESINYGRDVGYEVIEHKPPKEIGKIKGRESHNDSLRTV